MLKSVEKKSYIRILKNYFSLHITRKSFNLMKKNVFLHYKYFCCILHIPRGPLCTFYNNNQHMAKQIRYQINCCRQYIFCQYVVTKSYQKLDRQISKHIRVHIFKVPTYRFSISRHSVVPKLKISNACLNSFIQK